MKKKEALIILSLALWVGLCACNSRTESLNEVESATSIETLASESAVIHTEVESSVVKEQSNELLVETTEHTIDIGLPVSRGQTGGEVVTEVGTVREVSGKKYSIDVDDSQIVATVGSDTVRYDSGIKTGDLVVISYDRIEADGVPLSTISTVYALMKLEDTIETEEYNWESVEAELESESESVRESEEAKEESRKEAESISEELLKYGVNEIEDRQVTVYYGTIVERGPNGYVIYTNDNQKYFVSITEQTDAPEILEIKDYICVEASDEVHPGTPPVLPDVYRVYLTQ